MLRDRVREELAQAFPAEAPEDFETLLPTLDDLRPGGDREGACSSSQWERVLVDIVRLSQGDYERLEYWTDLAKQDRRDVIRAAEYPPDENFSAERLMRKLGLLVNCTVCGKPCSVESKGVSHHFALVGREHIDYAADADHRALPEERR